MIDTKLGGRKVYIPIGRERTEDLCILADCIAASNADLFDQDDCVIWIATGKRIAVTPDILKDIIGIYICTKHLRENADGLWEAEFRVFEPDDMTLRALLMAKTRNDGSLMARLPKAVGTVRQLPDSLRQAAKDRLRSGEPAKLIASAYNVDTATIEALGRW